MKKVIFVCTGNTCRSPMAEGMFKMFLKNKKIENIEVLSAGIACFTGDNACENAILAAKENGADISMHRSRKLNIYDFSDDTYFIAMTSSHEQAIKSIDNNAKVISLDVPDPYGQDLDVYRKTAEVIKSNFDDILDFINDEIEISKMIEADIEDIASIEKECFSTPWSENALREELTNSVADFFVAKKGEKTLGYIGSFNVLGEVSITNVAVFEKYRKMGVATKLINHLEKISRERKAEFITLEVRASNEKAINLYKKCGFENVGVRKNYYSKPQEDAILMTKYL